jgi:hypothetical protein
VTSVIDLIPTEDQLDRMLCVREREVVLLRRLLALARLADSMRAADSADRLALDQAGAEEATNARS